MHSLGICQANFMQVLLRKIDRRSKLIKKQEHTVSQNLKKKRIFLEEENFDIMTILKQAAKFQFNDQKLNEDISILRNENSELSE